MTTLFADSTPPRRVLFTFSDLPLHTYYVVGILCLLWICTGVVLGALVAVLNG